MSRINRNRFKLINETDLEVEMHAFTLNELVIEPAKNKQMETFYNWGMHVLVLIWILQI